MGYVLPSYEALYDVTSRLLMKFNTQTSRHIAPNLETIFDNTLKIVEGYVETEGDRITQAKALGQLVLELKSDANYLSAVEEKEKKENDEIIIAATQQIILGALVHRYLRITEEYKPTKKTVSKLGILGEFVTKKIYNPTPTNSCIYNKIGEILNLTEENKLDPLTIKTTCEFFESYMKQNNRYLRYPHYKADPNFTIHLEQLINKATLEAGSMLSQVKKIQFLMSLAKSIRIIHKECEILLENLEKNLTDKDLPLNLGIINKYVNGMILSDETRIRFNLLLNRENVSTNIDKWTINEFMMEMRTSLCTASQYALFGGYFVILQELTPQQIELKEILIKALNCDKPDNRLDAKTALNGLQFLKRWIMSINIDSAKIDWTLFEEKDIGKDMFFSQYKRAKNYLTKIQPESAQLNMNI